MCGIAGFSLHPSDRTTNARTLAKELLAEIESRGRHASGAAWVEDDAVWWDRAPLPGRAFASVLDLDPSTRTTILHTRYATHGNPSDNRNNHPFAVPGLTGIHNGVLDNHEDLWAMTNFVPTSETDSEALFGLLAAGGYNHPTDALELVEGSAAVAWLPSDRGHDLHLARLRGRPLAVAETLSGSMVFASTVKLLEAACRSAKVELSKVHDLSEGSFLRVRGGTFREVVPFNPPAQVWKPRKTATVGRRSVGWTS